MVRSIEGIVDFAIKRMTEYNHTPADVKKSLMRWTFDPNEKDIDVGVAEAAHRLGLGPRESPRMKMIDDSGRMELATNLMTKMGLSPNQVKKMLMRWAYDPDEGEINAVVAEVAHRLGLGSNETLSDKSRRDR